MQEQWPNSKLPDPKNEGTVILEMLGNTHPNYTVSHPRRLESSRLHQLPSLLQHRKWRPISSWMYKGALHGKPDDMTTRLQMSAAKLWRKLKSNITKWKKCRQGWRFVLMYSHMLQTVTVIFRETLLDPSDVTRCCVVWYKSSSQNLCCTICVLHFLSLYCCI